MQYPCSRTTPQRKLFAQEEINRKQNFSRIAMASATAASTLLQRLSQPSPSRRHSPLPASRTEAVCTAITGIEPNSRRTPANAFRSCTKHKQKWGGQPAQGRLSPTCRPVLDALMLSVLFVCRCLFNIQGAIGQIALKPLDMSEVHL